MFKTNAFLITCLSLLSASSGWAAVSILQTGENHLVLTAHEDTAEHLYSYLKVAPVSIGKIEKGLKSPPTEKKYATLDQSFDIRCIARPRRGLTSFFGLTSNEYSCTANFHLSPQDQSTDQFTINHALVGEDINLLITTFGLQKTIRKHRLEAETTVEAGDINTGVNFTCHLTKEQADHCQINMQVPFTADELTTRTY